MEFKLSFRPWHEVDPITKKRSRKMPVEGILLACGTIIDDIRHDVVVGLNASDHTDRDIKDLVSLARKTVESDGGILRATIAGKSFPITIGEGTELLEKVTDEPEPNTNVKGSPLTQSYYASEDAVRIILNFADAQVKKLRKANKKKKETTTE